MHQDLHDAVAALLRRRPHESVRVLKAYDGRRVLQCCEPPSVVQLELNGRPDGLRISGGNSTLDQLTQRGSRDVDAPPRIAPQEWMELDREYTQFHQRRRAALLAAIQADLRGDAPVAELLYRQTMADADHCLAIIAFARQKHPMGRLSAAAPAGRSVILLQRIASAALLRLLGGDPAGAIQHVADGIAEAMRTLTADHTPPLDVIVHDLEALKAHLCAASAQSGNVAPSGSGTAHRSLQPATPLAQPVTL